MPYPNEHAARLINPERFEQDSFRRKEVKPGISIIVGKIKGKDSMVPQSYRFDVKKFSAGEAKKWLADNNIKTILFEAARREQNKVSIQTFLQLHSKKLQAFSDNEILKMIPLPVLDEIRKKDGHPFFQAYSICHEGVAVPTVIGDDKPKPIRWLRKAIQSIANVALKGVKFFVGHNEDNSTDGRRAVGEVVADCQKYIGGKLHHVVVGYFPRKEEAQQYDICSQEADWNLIEKASHYVADKIQKITGIALGNSKEDVPAFKNAKRLAVMQAFEYNDEKNKSSGKDDTEENKPMTFSEIKTAIREMNIFPSQIFTKNEIKEDREFNPIFSENETLKTDLEKTKQQLGELQKTKELLEQEKKELGQTVRKTTAKTRLDKILNNPEQKYTDKQKQFIRKSFSEDLPDISDEGLNNFAQNQLKNFQAAAELFNVSDDTATTGQDDSDIQDTDDDNENYSQASNNELLEEDFELEE